MSRESRESRKLTAIRSISLEDVVKERHRRWRRLLRRRSTLLLVSLVALSAVAGGAAFSIWGGSGTGSVLAYESQPILLATLAPEAPRETPRRTPAPRPAAPAATAAAPIPLTIPEPQQSARMPKPRPDEPVVTGSISSAAPRPVAPRRYADSRRRDPCQVLQAITSRLPLRVHCF
jgi:hypothetical protein